MAKFYYLLFFIASVSAQNQDLTSLMNDLAIELAREIEALWDDDIRLITIFSDFDKATDRFFFRAILPWIVDNIGNDLRINYRFRNSGRSAGPRMCGLRTLRNNSYTQAEFLRCEALGNPILTCVNQAPIDRKAYNRCINTRVNDYVRTSQWEFDNLLSEETPLVRLNGRRELSSADPARLLRLICQAYGRIKPVGCLRPTAFVPQPRNVLDNISPILVPSNNAAPVTIPSTNAGPITTPSVNSEPITIPGNTATPITIPSSNAASVSIPTTNAAPITIPSKNAASVSIPSTNVAPLTIPSNNAASVSIPSINAAPITIPSGVSLSIPSFQLNAAPITIPSNTVAPITIPSSNAASISTPSTNAAPITIPSSNAASVSITSTNAAPLTIPSGISLTVPPYQSVRNK